MPDSFLWWRLCADMQREIAQEYEEPVRSALLVLAREWDMLAYLSLGPRPFIKSFPEIRKKADA